MARPAKLNKVDRVLMWTPKEFHTFLKVKAANERRPMQDVAIDIARFHKDTNFNIGRKKNDRPFWGKI